MPLLFQIDQIEIFKKNLFEENRTRLLRKKNIEKLKARPTMNRLNIKFVLIIKNVICIKFKYFRQKGFWGFGEIGRAHV